ncbi:MAG: CoA transferase [Chloroflexi bacterium]|nr:CoA transferase [Chloroflexota bacterium]
MAQRQAPESGEPSALGHLCVLDLTEGLGQMCARVLGDLGADVIKVEPLEGDPVRWLPPFAGEEPHPERSLRFINANRSKRGISLDITNPEGQGTIRNLARKSDIVVEDFSPGYLAALGLGYEDLRRLNQGLILVSITPFGQSGPFSHYQGGELVAQATAGLIFANGDDTKRPCMAPYELMSQMACLHAAFGALAAVRARHSTGRGQHVDVSRQEAVLYCQNSYISRYSYDATISKRNGTRSMFGAVNTFQCSDGGFVNLSVFNNGHFSRLARDIMDHPVLSQPEWSDRAARRDRRDEIDDMVKEYLATVTRDEFVERGQRLGVPVMPVITAEEFVHHPHNVARNYFESLEHSVIGQYRAPGPPIRMSGTPWRVHLPAPRLGEHTGEVLAEIEQVVEPNPQSNGSGGRLPLEGIRVADFTRAFAGPLTTMYLGFFGAEVIKVESADLEDNRTQGEPTFPDLNRNKLSCTIDARNDQGKELLKKLVSDSDVVVENFRPGVMDRLGIGYDVLRKSNPDLIMVSMPGMGSSGPYRDFYSYGQQIMGVSGLVHLWGHPDTPLNGRVKLAFPDYVAAIFSAVGILAALEHRDRSGEGQFLETAQLEATAHLLAVAYMDDGRTDAGIELFEQTLEVMERVLGPEHPETLGNRSNHGFSLTPPEAFKHALPSSGFRCRQVPHFYLVLVRRHRSPPVML